MAQEESFKKAFQAAKKALQAGQIDKSIELTGKILTHQPEEPRSLYLLAQAHRLKGEYLEAITAIREGLDILPGNKGFLQLLFYVHRDRGDFYAAAEVLERLYEGRIPQNPDEAVWLKILASLQPHLKQVNRGKKLSRRAVQTSLTKFSLPGSPRFTIIALLRLGQNFFYYYPEQKSIRLKKAKGEAIAANDWIGVIDKNNIACYELYVDG